MDHPMFPRKLDRISVTGEFKLGGLGDPDVIHAIKARLLAPSKAARMYGWGLIIVGTVMAFTIIGLALTIVMVPAGIFGLTRAKHNFGVVEDVASQLLAKGSL